MGVLPIPRPLGRLMGIPQASHGSIPVAFTTKEEGVCFNALIAKAPIVPAPTEIVGRPGATTLSIPSGPAQGAPVCWTAPPIAQASAWASPRAPEGSSGIPGEDKT